MQHSNPSPTWIPVFAIFGLFCSTLPAQQGSVDASNRVARILRGVLKAESLHLRESLTSARSGLIRIGGVVQAKKAEITEYTRVGDLEVWSKDEGRRTLGRRGARWVHKNPDGDWSPSLRPRGSEWATAFLCDPKFLAERLLAAAKVLPWKLEEVGELDSRPVRKFTCTIGSKDGRAFIRSGALPDGGSSTALGQFVFIGGGRVHAPEAEVRFEIELYEDPAKRLPARIVVRSFGKSPVGQQGQVIVLGGGVLQKADEEEEDEDKKKDKPTSTLILDFSDWGRAKIDDRLPAAAIAELATPEDASVEATKGKR